MAVKIIRKNVFSPDVEVRALNRFKLIHLQTLRISHNTAKPGFLLTASVIADEVYNWLGASPSHE